MSSDRRSSWYRSLLLLERYWTDYQKYGEAIFEKGFSPKRKSYSSEYELVRAYSENLITLREIVIDYGVSRTRFYSMRKRCKEKDPHVSESPSETYSPKAMKKGIPTSKQSATPRNLDKEINELPYEELKKRYKELLVKDLANKILDEVQQKKSLGQNCARKAK